MNDKAVHIRVPDDLYQKVMVLCGRDERLSDFIRRAMEHEVYYRVSSKNLITYGESEKDE